MELRTDRFKFKDLFPDKADQYAKTLQIKVDDIAYIRKGIPINPSDISIQEGERAAIRYITTPKLDRDSEILIPDGAVLDDFRASPSVLFAHKHDQLPVGKDVWIKPTKKGILAKTVYANHNFAEDVFQCVKGGFLNSNSVGFIPLEVVGPGNPLKFRQWQDTLEKEYGIPKDESSGARSIYTKWILIEHSDVPVASNVQSLNIAVAKGLLSLTNGQLKKDLQIEVEREITIDEPEKQIDLSGSEIDAYIQKKLKSNVDQIFEKARENFHKNDPAYRASADYVKSDDFKKHIETEIKKELGRLKGRILTDKEIESFSIADILNPKKHIKD
jgi:hypothetical protein